MEDGLFSLVLSYLAPGMVESISNLNNTSILSILSLLSNLTYHVELDRILPNINFITNTKHATRRHTAVVRSNRRGDFLFNLPFCAHAADPVVLAHWRPDPVADKPNKCWSIYKSP